MRYKNQANEILDSSRMQLSTLLPSEWTEEHRVLTTDISPFPGRFTYKRTPYLREVVDCLSPYHDAKIIAVMKGSQIGFSTGVIESGIGYIIAESPSNILFLTGHTELAEEAMNKKIDQMIESCGLRSMIKPSIMRMKNQRTGDTSKGKEFPGGSLVAGSASNHKLLRQRSVRYGFIDDFDAAKKSTKESGDTTTMIEQRFAAYGDKMKLFYISTPERKESSNIEPVFLLGDQRRYHLPCPHCGTAIPLYWSVEIDDTDGREKGGLTWRTTAAGLLIPGTVEYVCQSCGVGFDDSNKGELLEAGHWKPMATPSQEGYYSYHISSLYAPPGMYDWEHYVREFIAACPEGQPRREEKYKAFINLVLGETYEKEGESPKANELQKNTRNYEPGVVPEKTSIRDGNGKVVLLTCAADMNGTEDDARLDYEVVAWSESGASYSIIQGSVGTFIYRESTKGMKEDRQKWTYHRGRTYSVWSEFERVLSAIYMTDTDRKMKIFISGLDCGYHSQHAYTFIDKTNMNVFGLKGKDVEVYTKSSTMSDVPAFRIAKERNKLFLVEVNAVKDDLAEIMKLKWDDMARDKQPPGFMNYPQPSKGMYSFKNFFAHYESEHRVFETKPSGAVVARWVKKSSNSQNHFWDVRVYNMAIKDILVSLVCKELKLKYYTWEDYVDLVLQRKKAA